MPVPDVDDGVGEMLHENARVRDLFVVADFHDSAGGADGGVAAGDEALDPGFCGGVDQTELVELPLGANGTEHDVDTFEYLYQRFGIIEIGRKDLQAAVPEFLHGRFVGGCGSH